MTYYLLSSGALFSSHFMQPLDSTGLCCPLVLLVIRLSWVFHCLAISRFLTTLVSPFQIFFVSPSLLVSHKNWCCFEFLRDLDLLTLVSILSGLVISANFITSVTIHTDHSQINKSQRWIRALT